MHQLLATFLWIFAPAAVADISDSGSALIGGQAIIVGTMTVQGNGFNVGGSTFVVVGTSVGIRAAVPAAALDVNGSAQFGSGATRSTFTAAGLLKLGSSGVQFSDGTTQTTAASAPAAKAFAYSLITSQTDTTSTSFTTLTSTSLVTSGGRVHFTWNCSCKDTSASGQSNSWAIQEDSSYFDGQGSSIGLLDSSDQGSSARLQDCSFVYTKKTAPSAGSHTYTLLFKTSAYTLRVNSGGTLVCQFAVQEL